MGKAGITRVRSEVDARGEHLNKQDVLTYEMHGEPSWAWYRFCCFFRLFGMLSFSSLLFLPLADWLNLKLVQKRGEMCICLHEKFSFPPGKDAAMRCAGQPPSWLSC